MPRPLASNGPAARIGDVHIDQIIAINGSKIFDRTQVSTEAGAPSTAHRQRQRLTLPVQILISDVWPIFGALLIGLWEVNHAAQTRARLERLQLLGSTVQFFDGRRLWTVPGGRSTWIIDELQEVVGGDEKGTYRATVILGEDSRFQTTFTSIDPNLSSDLQDASDGVVDKGQQSTEAVPADLAASIPT